MIIIKRDYIGSTVYLSFFLILVGCGQSAPDTPAADALAPALVQAAPKVMPDIAPTAPFQATGVKIGEITPSEAIIWTRLTHLAEPISTDAPVPEILYQAPGEEELQEDIPGRFHPHDWVPVVIYPEGSSIETIRSAAIGAPGETRVVYRKADENTWASTDWGPVDPDRDFTGQFKLTGLASATDYVLRVEGRAAGSTVVSSSTEGQFGTAPDPDQPTRVVFSSVTGTDYEDQDLPGGGFQIHRAMMDMGVDFFVHTGDIIYYDAYAKNVDLARWGWARMFGLETNLDFHRNIPTYFMKDDHDVWQDDTWPTQASTYMGDLTYQDGIEIFKEQVPMEDLTYRTFRWGQDVQIWLVEGRDYRDANMDPDGPDKSIWGEEQMAWFKETVQASDATFRILISPTPVVGPDNDDKYDSHANPIWSYEGDELREFMAMQENMIVICGDRHWQYVSEHDDTGVREYGTGPASDTHTAGWSSNDDVRPEHRYLNIIGGFLSVTVDRVDGVPTMAMRHHHVDGEVLFEDILTVESLAVVR
jgi:alkaline phosphatase D